MTTSSRKDRNALAGRSLVRVTSLKSRHAFTLLELLLVLAVLAAIASIVIPQTGILLGDRQVARSGEQVRIEMTRLRVDAMRQGRVMMMQGMLEGNTVRIKPYYSLADSTEALDQTGSQNALLSGASQATVAAPMMDAEQEKTIELAENVTITAVATVSAARSFEIEQLAAADAGSGWSLPILFYPDGTTSTAAVTLSQESIGKVIVKIRGITGDATVSEVLP
jgi:prepilin-type N-terminal cleavage/methylation domain-containing protein